MEPGFFRVGKRGFLGHVPGVGSCCECFQKGTRQCTWTAMCMSQPTISSGSGWLWVERLTQGASLTPFLAWQLNEVYRQITGAHKLQQTKFRWVLGARGRGRELPPLPTLGPPPPSRSMLLSQRLWLMLPSLSPHRQQPNAGKK